MTVIGVVILVMFVAMLVGLLLLHHHKLWVVIAGFLVIGATFVWGHGWTEEGVSLSEGLTEFAHHFSEWHRFHLLYNLTLMLPGFALVAHYFEHSGASQGIAKMLRKDALVLWAVFWLSMILDNIAAAMIGGTILLAMYGKGRVPFPMLIGIICASNLGGAGSPVGDTTTVMMFVSQDPKIGVLEIMTAFVATIPAQLLLVAWAARSGQGIMPTTGIPELPTEAREEYDDRHLGEDNVRALEEGTHEKRVNWRWILPLLGIPGLVVGNLLDQPGFGLWAGVLLGVLLGWIRFERKAAWSALPNTAFLVLLVATAEMLPLHEVKPYLEALTRDQIAILMGLLSAWFDNIPLTAICLSLKDFDWGLLAYCAGFGGSAMWFGSSAGVALGLLFKEVYDTKRWIKPFFVVTGIYLAGVACYMAAFHGLPWLMRLPQPYALLTLFGGTFAAWAAAGAFELLPKRRNLTGILAFGIIGAILLVCAFASMAQ